MRWFFIGLLVLVVAACRPSVRGVKPTERLCCDLMAIDSMMWHQPDSAFSMLLEFADSPAADTLDDFNGHYFQLLVSELLYKNDYEQTNRDDLMKAVAYFDTIGNAFLDARAHYINGVGFYERDSVVEACTEYLKAVEVMEERYDEKDLVGQKAHFMALVYTRLTVLYSNLYLNKQAIHFGRCSLPYYEKYDNNDWELSWHLSGGSGGNVYWNPDGEPLHTTKGVIKNSSTDLAHELFHALDSNRGLLDNKEENMLSRTEWQACYRENILRSQLNYPIRTDYQTKTSTVKIVEGKTNTPIRPFWY